MSQVEVKILESPLETRVIPKKRAFAKDEKIDWAGAIPFIGVHLVGIFAIFTGITWIAVAM